MPPRMRGPIERLQRKPFVKKPIPQKGKVDFHFDLPKRQEPPKQNKGK